MILESKIRTIKWEDNVSKVIDQTLLPYEYKYIEIKSIENMYESIKNMIVRGAPAIGIAGAHGVVLGAYECEKEYGNDIIQFKDNLIKKSIWLKTSRPTAVNLMWAIDKQIEIIKKFEGCNIQRLIEELERNVKSLEEDDIKINKKIGENGAKLVGKSWGILTHCNAGALATVGYGTALGVIRSAYANDKTIKVYANETRPRQQGARLTTWELIEDGIDVTLLTDAMCSYFMKSGYIDMVVVGADRIALNGDTANKIGTYTLAICAKYHNIPFYIAAPKSTIDVKIKNGNEIPIEIRDENEVFKINGKLICREGTKTINPSFDVTPNELISGIILEDGIISGDYEKEIKKLFNM